MIESTNCGPPAEAAQPVGSRRSTPKADPMSRAWSAAGSTVFGISSAVLRRGRPATSQRTHVAASPSRYPTSTLSLRAPHIASKTRPRSARSPRAIRSAGGPWLSRGTLSRHRSGHQPLPRRRGICTPSRHLRL